MNAVALGFVIIVGLGVFLLAVLAVLSLAYAVDTARSARATAEGVQQLVSLPRNEALSAPEPGSASQDTNHRPSAPQRTNQEP